MAAKAAETDKPMILFEYFITFSLVNDLVVGMAVAMVRNLETYYPSLR
ncbi:MAG: hypothetical protein K2Y31_11555 [Burkholderiales bacterium]|nr:hypothetical protein [Burkholderiales bacterium]